MLVFHLGFPAASTAAISMRNWADFVRSCESGDFEVLWHSNERFFREMFIRMSVSATATSRIGLGGAIADAFVTHPAVIAQSLGTLDELSAGRATLAYGAGGSGFPMMGIERRDTVDALRDAYSITKRLLQAETVTYEGRHWRAQGARLHFDPPSPPTLWIATRGRQTLQLAGEIADGVMVASHARVDLANRAMSLIERGLEHRKSGDRPRVLLRIDTCVHQDPGQAREGSRLIIAKLLWASYPDRRFVESANLEVPPELEALIEKRDYDLMHDAVSLVPDSFVDAFCWAGTPEDVAARASDVARGSGITELGFWVMPAGDQSLQEAVQMLAGSVLPLIRAGA